MNTITYIKHHAEKMFSIDGNTVKELDLNAPLNVKNSDKKFENFKFSFDSINFKNEEDTILKLTNLINDFSDFSVSSSYKKEIIKRFEPDKKKEEEFEKNTDIKILKKEYVTEEYYKKERKLVKYTYEKNYTREGTLDNTFVAIHTKSYEEVEGKKLYDVKPHIHLVFPLHSNNFGNNYYLLKDRLERLCSEHNLISSLQKLEVKDVTKEKEIEMQILKKRLTTFSWKLAKHEEGKYVLRDLEKDNGKGKDVVTLENIQEKADRYLELGGSVSFIKKIKINMETKIDQTLKLNPNEQDMKAFENIKNKDYKAIIDDVSYKAITGQKISEFYRGYNRYVKGIDIKEVHLTQAIKELFSASQKSLDSNNELYIDIEKIKEIQSKYLDLFLEKKIEKEQPIEDNKNNIYKILNQQELRIFVRENEIDLQKETGKNEFQLLYNNNLNYVMDNINISKEDILSLQKNDELEEKVLKTIDSLGLKITDNWKQNIVKEIVLQKYNITIESKKEIKKSKNKTVSEVENEVKLILNQVDLIKYEKENKIDLQNTFNRSIFNILFNNNLDFVSENINVDKVELLEGYKNKNIKNIISNRIDNLNLNFNDKWKDNITNKVVKNQLGKLNECNIIDLTAEYNKRYYTMQYVKKLESSLNLEKEKKNPNTKLILQTERQIKNFEITNYLKFLDSKFELEKAEARYIGDTNKIINLEVLQKENDEKKILEEIQKGTVLETIREFINNKGEKMYLSEKNTDGKKIIRSGANADLSKLFTHKKKQYDTLEEGLLMLKNNGYELVKESGVFTVYQITDKEINELEKNPNPNHILDKEKKIIKIKTEFTANDLEYLIKMIEREKQLEIARAKKRERGIGR